MIFPLLPIAFALPKFNLPSVKFRAKLLEPDNVRIPEPILLRVVRDKLP